MKEEGQCRIIQVQLQIIYIGSAAVKVYSVKSTVITVLLFQRRTCDDCFVACAGPRSYLSTAPAVRPRALSAGNQEVRHSPW